MTAIRRNRESVDYRYDRFGRMTQDGALTYGYDKNSNRTTIGYPGGVTATYTYDYADRQATLTFQDGEQPPQALVTSASYKPFGPLRTLRLGNGLTETRTFTTRYFPVTIEAPERLSWTYETDAVGNVTAITDHLDPTSTRVFHYQNYQYYLLGGIGPWGTLSWTYDKLGNRLRETRNGVLSTYAYRTNAAGLNSPQLKQVLEEDKTVRARHFFDPTGNMTHSASKNWKYQYSYNAANRLAHIRRDSIDTVPGVTNLRYDGRNFLSDSTFVPELPISSISWSTRATYSSEGTFYHRSTERRITRTTPRSSPAIEGADYVFFLAGRPVALLQKKTIIPPSGSTSNVSTLYFAAADHLGGLLLLVDNSGQTRWKNTREPFGASVSDEPEASDLLAFPGQWIDETWTDSTEDTLRASLHYNLRRWYHPGLARFIRPDPLGILPPGRSASNLYIYAINNPIANYDPWGLDAVTNDKGIQDCIYCIYYKAGYGHHNTEEAFWVICEKNKLSCELWPPTANQGTSVQSNTKFKGKIPKNACALFHTHPRQKPQKPSTCPGCDTDVARGLGMPIYSVHPNGIWKFDPNSGKITNEAGKKWYKPIKERCKKPCKGLP
ncbi:MAG: RHS repeat-associated core domain-containing protein [Proteobacteria bacterium]|nr:RHS repeat-associated core domain-containing protein [Pseudomonadota bacterium]